MDHGRRRGPPMRIPTIPGSAISPALSGLCLWRAGRGPAPLWTDLMPIFPKMSCWTTPGPPQTPNDRRQRNRAPGDPGSSGPAAPPSSKAPERAAARILRCARGKRPKCCARARCLLAWTETHLDREPPYLFSQFLGGTSCAAGQVAGHAAGSGNSGSGTCSGQSSGQLAEIAGKVAGKGSGQTAGRTAGSGQRAAGSGNRGRRAAMRC
eukprot:gene12681-biopygen7957